MENRPQILGIDIGSVAIAIAAVTTAKEVVRTAYGFHHGNIPKALMGLLADLDLTRIRWVATTWILQNAYSG